ncbi:ABC transporter permease [Alkaliphilus hydrothermalis]|uniref:ABC-2 type transport system permease protein n=1 Tax=Alkaliphilus hydrothermalis TaxID=1482730 RepID=A0ABS2NTX8_9FIRM|nr:ABC transporter permease [Alkaliphilus hydrothermalis]MBM7616402.1 ABC-2 type transport system permease protein [Alkaliphilus hydrothermalis]
MKKLNALVTYQFKLQSREFINLFFIIVFPVIMYVFFSNMLAGELFYNGSFEAIDFLLPAYIPIVTTNTILLIFGHMLISHKEHNFFIKYKLMGFKPLQVAGALFLAVFIFQILGIATLIITAVITNGVRLPIDNLFQVLLILLLINFFQFTVTFCVGSIFTKSSTYQSVALIIFYFQMFLGGMTFPPEMFPEKIRLFSQIFNPIIHGLHMMRGIWIMGKSIWDYPVQLTILLGVSGILLLIGINRFKWSDLYG